MGKKTFYRSIKDSQVDGIAIVHQELATSPHLSVVENMFIGDYRSRFGFVNFTQQLEEAKAALALVNVHNLDPNERMGSLSVAKQQLIEIAKALAKKARILVLDEPTSSLNDQDSQHLLKVMKDLKQEGITIIFVSHKLDEVLAVSDSIVAIRDGKFVSQYPNDPKVVNEARLIRDIVGRELNFRFPPKPKTVLGETFLEIKNFSVEHPAIVGRDIVKRVSLSVKAGEIVGIAGIVGSGRTELFMALFGRSYGRNFRGQVLVRNKPIQLRSPHDAIRKGVMYASEDRKSLGLVQLSSVRENIGMSAFDRFSRFGFLKTKEIASYAEQMRTSMRIKVPTIEYAAGTLSGGNQQKVVLARALTAQPDVLIIDEPTRGIDIGSKYEIYEIIYRLASYGKAVIVISSEIPELLGITDRVYVMANGEIKGEVDTKEATQEGIISLALLKKINEQAGIGKN
ncbi:unnamed protein product [Didymodactylos carnosus]|uniref:ABC transporter domain-containing protein n=1 Tax=Didymodactylos carnosus TaxID=1234261 RepID=A0A8S2HH51_9BILA|nr:unnamed protein product [Didymodactylos carnosus]CAF3623190.1 unnamed protein product [Didymodactylos carnosus]